MSIPNAKLIETKTQSEIDNWMLIEVLLYVLSNTDLINKLDIQKLYHDLHLLSRAESAERHAEL